jgi:hypothetical protein
MPAEITTADMLGELRRELAMRERLYPGWVADKKMPREKANRQVAVLKAAIAKIEETRSYEEVRGGV